MRAPLSLGAFLVSVAVGACSGATSTMEGSAHDESTGGSAAGMDTGKSGASGWGAAGLAGASGASAGRSGAGAGGGSSTAGSACGLPSSGGSSNNVPPPTPAPTPDGTGFDVQVVKTMLLGDTGWESTSPTGDDWQDYAFDVDGLHFTDACQAHYHCQLQPGADVDHELFDGPMGVDNSFGRNVVPFLTSLASDPSQAETAIIAAGDYSLAIQLQKIAAGSDDSGVHAQIFAVQGSDVNGGTSGNPTPPTDAQWIDGSYVWHPYADSLTDASVTDPSLYQSTERFEDSYITENQWVSGTKGTVHLRLGIAGGTYDLFIHQAVLTLQLSSDHRIGTHGILGGVLSVQELAMAIAENDVPLDIHGCTGFPNELSSIVAEVGAMADINLDGTQHPDEPCDGISIGIGFLTTAATLGGPAPGGGIYDPCGAYGGSGGSGG